MDGRTDRQTNHGKSDVGLLQRRSVVGSVPRDGDPRLGGTVGTISLTGGVSLALHWNRQIDRQTNHGKSDVGLLQCRSVVGSVPCDGHHLAVRIESTVDDTFDQRVLVLRR